MTTPTLYSWFADSARRYPDRTALEVGGLEVSYARLHDLVERLAGSVVRGHGRVPGAVGTVAVRDLAGYASYLASLRLGAVVVPLNPNHPARRNLAVTAAAAVEVVITDDSAAGAQLAAAAGGATVVTLPGGWAEHGGPRAGGDLPPPPTGGGVAYLLFTSGSTGSPKGVPVLHENVSAYLRHVLASYPLEPGCRLPNTADLTFDISVGELFAAWGSGATLVAPRSRGDLINPVRYVNDCRLTNWFSVPSVVSLAKRLRLLAPGCMPTLRTSMFAGEPLTVGQAEAWAAAAPDSTIDNLYGPTETTITCAGYRLPRDRSAWPVTSNGTLPIGHVYPNTEGVVVDEEGRPAEHGELLLRGEQRFPGYLDPEHDRGRFVLLSGPAARAEESGPVTPAHWYRTGDRVRVEGGLLVHLGRIDFQVKIHGYRIELEEIEAVLRRHPGVDEAVVVPVAEDGGDAELVAVYTGSVVDPVELDAVVAEALPTYMHPRRVEHASDLPLTKNGKIDRAALAARLAARREGDRVPVSS